MQSNVLTPSEADFQMLWRINPVAYEQLHWIVAERMLAERENALASANAKIEALHASAGTAG